MLSSTENHFATRNQHLRLGSRPNLGIENWSILHRVPKPLPSRSAMVQGASSRTLGAYRHYSRHPSLQAIVRRIPSYAKMRGCDSFDVVKDDVNASTEAIRVERRSGTLLPPSRILPSLRPSSAIPPVGLYYSMIAKRCLHSLRAM